MSQPGCGRTATGRPSVRPSELGQGCGSPWWSLPGSRYKDSMSLFRVSLGLCSFSHTDARTPPSKKDSFAWSGAVRPGT